MPSNTLAKATDRAVNTYQPAPVAQTPEAQMWQVLSQQATVLSSAQDMLPKAYRGPQAAAKLMAAGLMGSRHGWDIMTSAMCIDVVEGKPRYTTEALLALVRKAGHRVQIDEADGSATCTITRRDTGEAFTVTWTRQRAQQAGLAGKDNWKKYEPDMLRWRAIGAAAKIACSEVTLGLASDPDDDAADWLPPAASGDDRVAIDAEVIEPDDEPATGPESGLEQAGEPEGDDYHAWSRNQWAEAAKVVGLPELSRRFNVRNYDALVTSDPETQDTVYRAIVEADRAGLPFQ